MLGAESRRFDPAAASGLSPRVGGSLEALAEEEAAGAGYVRLRCRRSQICAAGLDRRKLTRCDHLQPNVEQPRCGVSRCLLEGALSTHSGRWSPGRVCVPAAIQADIQVAAGGD